MFAPLIIFLTLLFLLKNIGKVCRNIRLKINEITSFPIIIKLRSENKDKWPVIFLKTGIFLVYFQEHMAQRKVLFVFFFFQ